MNRLDFYLVDDPREKPLRDAVYRAIARLTHQPERPLVAPAPDRAPRSALGTVRVDPEAPFSAERGRW
jgi:hypothetical protein